MDAPGKRRTPPRGRPASGFLGSLGVASCQKGAGERSMKAVRGRVAGVRPRFIKESTGLILTAGSAWARDTRGGALRGAPVVPVEASYNQKVRNDASWSQRDRQSLSSDTT